MATLRLPSQQDSFFHHSYEMACSSFVCNSSTVKRMGLDCSIFSIASPFVVSALKMLAKQTTLQCNPKQSYMFLTCYLSFYCPPCKHKNETTHCLLSRACRSITKHCTSFQGPQNFSSGWMFNMKCGGLFYGMIEKPQLWFVAHLKQNNGDVKDLINLYCAECKRNYKKNERLLD